MPSDSMRLSRRAVAALFGAGALRAAPQAAQPAPVSQENDAERAAIALRRNAAAIAKVDVPRATEPAFQFLP